MQADEREAFDAFARGRMRKLLRFAHLLTGDPHRAADLVQDALERTLISWHRVERKDDPEAYVRRAIVNRHVSVDPDKVQVKVDRGAKVSTLEVDIEFPNAGANAAHA